jgi:DNA-binding NtrC family response regulator
MKTILVVDDEPQLRQLYRDIFEDREWRVLEADGADAALDILKSAPVDLAILDIRMPGVHGLDLLRQLHATRPRLPVILCTALGGLFSDYAVWEAGQQVAGLFTKPVDVDRLLSRVAEVLEGAPEEAPDAPVTAARKE